MMGGYYLYSRPDNEGNKKDFKIGICDIEIEFSNNKLQLYPDTKTVALSLVHAVLGLHKHWHVPPGGSMEISLFKIKGDGTKSTLEWTEGPYPEEFIKLQKYFHRFINLVAFM